MYIIVMGKYYYQSSTNDTTNINEAKRFKKRETAECALKNFCTWGEIIDLEDINARN